MEKEYKDSLQEGLRDRVTRRLEDRGDDLPSELKDIDQERLVYNVTSIGMGKLNMLIDLVIDSAILTFQDLVRYAPEKKVKE